MLNESNDFLVFTRTDTGEDVANFECSTKTKIAGRYS